MGLADPTSWRLWLNKQYRKGYYLIAVTNILGRPKYTAVMKHKEA